MKIKIPKVVLWLAATSFFTDVASEAVVPLFPLFLTGSMGAAPWFIGLLDGLADAVASLTKLLAGWASDRQLKSGRSSRAPWVIGGYGLSSFLRPLIGFALTPVTVLVLRVGDRFGKGIRTAPRDAWIVDVSDESERGRVFGFQRSMDHLGAMAGPLLAGLYLWLYPHQYRQLFIWTFIPGVLAIACTLVAWKKFPPVSISKSKTLVDANLKMELSSLEHREHQALRKFYFWMALFVMGNASDSFLILLLKERGFKEASILLLWAGIHAVRSWGAGWGGKLADRSGSVRALSITYFAMALSFLALGLVTEPRVALCLVVLHGLFLGLIEAPERATVAMFAPLTKRGSSFGLFHFIQGIGVLPANLLFGFVWTRYGSAHAYLLGAFFAFFAAIGIKKVR